MSKGILDTALNLVGLQRRPSRVSAPARRIVRPGNEVRSYHGAEINRLNSDWVPSDGPADYQLRNNVATLRARSRQLERDSRYVRRWLSALEANTLGAEGINLQMKIRFNTGRYDTGANKKIEDAWAEWGKMDYCCMNREDDWLSLQKLVLRSCARDGGIFVRKVRGPEAGPFGFSLEPIEIDMLDINYTEVLANGNEIRLGVERNRWQQVVAYHLIKVMPGERYIYPLQRMDRVRVNASDIIHYYVKDRVLQSIGVPWVASAMRQLHQLDEYQYAELTAARAASCKGGFWTSDRGDQWSGEEEVTTDSEGNQSTQVYDNLEPNSFDEAPPGKTFTPYDPKHPTDAFEKFCVATLQGVGAGLDIDYATLTGDLSKTSYSSSKAGRLEIQEVWKKIQGHFISHFCIPVFSSWLEMALLTRKVNLPMSKYDTLNKPKFRGRRWPWVEPQKDADAAIKLIEAKLRTRTEVIAENGGDFEDTIEQLGIESEIIEEAGLKDEEPKPGQIPGAQPKPNGQEDDDEDVNDQEDDVSDNSDDSSQDE